MQPVFKFVETLRVIVGIKLEISSLSEILCYLLKDHGLVQSESVATKNIKTSLCRLFLLLLVKLQALQMLLENYGNILCSHKKKYKMFYIIRVLNH